MFQMFNYFLKQIQCAGEVTFYKHVNFLFQIEFHLGAKFLLFVADFGFF